MKQQILLMTPKVKASNSSAVTVIVNEVRDRLSFIVDIKTSEACN